MTMPLRALAFTGPTASGKTALAIAVAEAIGGEIISCDSMQIYRGMDIGTAKATDAERRRVPHHLIDFLPPGVPYSAAQYGDDALRVATDITARGKIPVFCGGTGLYLDAACTGRHAHLPGSDANIRARLTAEAGTPEGRDALYDRLRSVDPLAATAIPTQNTRRVIRALEIFECTGRTKSAWDEESRALPPLITPLVFLLDFRSRDLLYHRIDCRVDAMLDAGLESEVTALLAAGYLSPDTTAGQAIGYKEIAAYLRGDTTRDDAIAALKTATHRYAKRQLTWFRAMHGTVRVSPDTSDGTVRDTAALLAEILPVVRDYLTAPAATGSKIPSV